MYLPISRYGRLGVWCLLLFFLVSCSDPDPAALSTSQPDASPIAANPTSSSLSSLTPTAAAAGDLPPATETPLPYPIVTETAVGPYPIASSTPLQATATLLPVTTPGSYDTYLPYLPHPAPTVPPTPTFTPTPTATPTPAPTPTPIPVLDFAALREQLRANGQDLATVKIGFHTSVGGNTEGLDRWMEMLDAAGVPFFLKSVDNAQPLFFAQELMKQSGVPHVLVFRRASGSIYNVPEYELTPELAAQRHWERHMEIWPPELDPSLIWLETINEVDRTEAEWLGQFALATADLAQAAGYKWAAFGWASGEPEPEHWQEPSMLEFLRLAGQNPERLAIAVHEYSYVLDDIGHEYPFKVGRFQELFRICDQYGIPRPTVLITEWGWTYNNVPDPADAIRDIAWASRLYAPYPEVKGAAIWFLGIGYDRIADQTQKLIEPLLVYSLTNYHTAPLPPAEAPINPDAYRPDR